MNEKIDITKENGTHDLGEIICVIENVSTRRRFLYYTLNEVVGTMPNGTIKIYVSKLKQDDPVLDTPITVQEWDTLKGYMGNALKGVENADAKYVPMNEIGTAVSVSDRAIAMPISYDYVNKQRGLYAEKIAMMETPTAAPVPPVTEPVPIIESQPVPIEEPALTENIAVPEAPTMMDNPEVQPIVPKDEEPITTPVEKLAEPSPVVPPVVNETEDTDSTNSESALNFEPIDISSIEAKYETMKKDIDALKEKEIEAAKRYNTTLELNTMHNEQHASYVMNEQTSVAPAEPAPQPLFKDEPVTNVQGSVPFVEPPIINNVEPTPVSPVVPEAPSTPAVETNWFDMPVNQ